MIYETLLYVLACVLDWLAAMTGGARLYDLHYRMTTQLIRVRADNYHKRRAK